MVVKIPSRDDTNARIDGLRKLRAGPLTAAIRLRPPVDCCSFQHIAAHAPNPPVQQYPFYDRSRSICSHKASLCSTGWVACLTAVDAGYCMLPTRSRWVGAGGRLGGYVGFRCSISRSVYFFRLRRYAVASDIYMYFKSILPSGSRASGTIDGCNANSSADP